MKLTQQVSDDWRLVIYNTKWGKENIFIGWEVFHNGQWEEHSNVLVGSRAINDLQTLLSRAQKLLPLL